MYSVITQMFIEINTTAIIIPLGASTMLNNNIPTVIGNKTIAPSARNLLAINNEPPIISIIAIKGNSHPDFINAEINSPAAFGTSGIGI